MRIIFLFAFLLIVVTISVYFFYSSSIIPQKDDVVISKTKNLQTSNPILIFYWAEWCGICKKIKPIWNQTKENLVKEYPNLLIKEIECDDPSKCYIIKNNKKNTIEGVPTIILRRSNVNDIEYEKDHNNNITGSKKVEDLRKFLNLYLKK
jgi:thiol-disulfide isomerase/thioredoxin